MNYSAGIRKAKRINSDNSDEKILSNFCAAKCSITKLQSL